MFIDPVKFLYRLQTTSKIGNHENDFLILEKYETNKCVTQLIDSRNSKRKKTNDER